MGAVLIIVDGRMDLAAGRTEIKKVIESLLDYAETPKMANYLFM